MTYTSRGAIVAIVDSDAAMRDTTARRLCEAGYNCAVFSGTADFLTAFRRETFDAVIADWPQGEAQGGGLTAELRLTHMSAIPIIVHTCGSDEALLVSILNAGADELVPKESGAAVLPAKLNALLRRAQGAVVSGVETHAGLRFSHPSMTVQVEGVEKSLTPTEFQLSLLFFRNLGRPLSRAYLTHRVWGLSAEIRTRTLDTHICRIRQKLSLYPDKGFNLVMMYGFGYRLDEVVEAAGGPKPEGASPPAPSRLAAVGL